MADELLEKWRADKKVKEAERKHAMEDRPQPAAPSTGHRLTFEQLVNYEAERISENRRADDEAKRRTLRPSPVGYV